MSSKRAHDSRYGEPSSRSGRYESSSGAPSKASRAGLNEFFLNGEGIHREVLQREICKYLGPEAFSRPMKYNGIQGYMVTAVRPFTSEMVNDLIALSDAFISEARDARRKGRQDISYEESATSRMRDEEEIYSGRYTPQAPSPYSMAPAPSGYPASLTSNYPPTPGGGYPVSAYGQDGGYPQGSTYGPTSGYPSTSRPTAQSSAYTYEEPVDAYRQNSGYPPRDSQMRPDPRPDPRFVQVDPRDARGPRQDSSMMPPYTYLNSPPGGVAMPNDPRYADYNPGMDPSRGGTSYGPSSRVPASGYGSRESPQLRDPYRHEPVREESRRERRR